MRCAGDAGPMTSTPASSAFSGADEQAHEPGASPWWVETWAFDVWTAEGLAACTSFTRLPNQGSAWYWAAVVRPGLPVIHLADVTLPPARPGLEVRTGGLWAAHVCEAPFEQWTVGNEAYAVALDDPAEALGRALGVVTPVAFDLEWYASGPAGPVPGGYAQAGSVDGVIELAGGGLELEGAPSRRVHGWGERSAAGPAMESARPRGVWVPFAMPGPDGPEVLDRVAGPDGWWEQRRPADLA
jgi:hypothetical protein